VRSDKGNHVYITTARRMISELVLKHLNGERLIIGAAEGGYLLASTQLPLTERIVFFRANLARMLSRSVFGVAANKVRV
jgi:hypothetical protein